jgi:flavodoxin I
MAKIGLFYGSDTGKTETIAEKIQDIIGRKEAELTNLSDIKAEEVLDFDLLIFGAPTWYDGELQSDWEKYYQKCKN